MSAPFDLDAITLAYGAHDRRTDGVCVMEAVAWWAGEDHSDRPECASPAIAAFLRSWNDALPDDDRQQLRRWVPEVVGTNAGPAVDAELSWIALDWLVRVHAPAWLRLAGLIEQAALLTDMAEITPATCPSILPTLTAVCSDARAAAGDAAGAATGDAAGDTACALTVRDLIGQRDGWDQAAYDALTGPWRRTIGPIHPDDAPMSDYLRGRIDKQERIRNVMAGER